MFVCVFFSILDRGLSTRFPITLKSTDVYTRPPLALSPPPLSKLETAMANRRARPSLLLPAWRAVGFAVGSGATALLPAEVSARVGDAIGRAVQEQYDANIRTMYEARIENEESEVSEVLGYCCPLIKWLFSEGTW